MAYPSLPTAIQSYRLPFRWELVQYVTGERNYSLFVLIHRQPYLSAKTLAIYEPTLPPYMVRVHKGYIINKRFVKQIDFDHKSLLMADGKTITVARRRWNTVIAYLLQKNDFN